MALNKLGSGSEEGMQLLAGWAGNEPEDGKGGGRGILNLAIERIARVAANIIASGSASGNLGDIGGGKRGEQEPF